MFVPSLSRRRFLKSSALLALSPIVPAFLPRLAFAAGTQEASNDGRILVVVQLDGGNDGLNTVIPYADDGYHRSRPRLRVRPEDLIKLTDRVGLPRSMQAAAKLVEDGRLAIVQGVGYPNPNRSHFHSMAIWQTADPKVKESDGSALGWLGKAFDRRERPADGTDAVFVGTDDLPRALVGRRAAAMSMSAADDLALRLPADERAARAGGTDNDGARADEELLTFVRRRVLEAYGTADQLTESARGTAADVAYPQTPLGNRLRLIARIIRSGTGTRVYYVSHGSFDTHSDQAQRHPALLAEFAGAVKAFMDDLKAAKLSERVLLLSFSEFGRRVAENGSGTDHGTAGPVFVAGDAVRPGTLGEMPDLSNLDNGDLKATSDFRQVYSSILEDWLRIPADPVLGGTFKPVPILRPA
jgi:uncharacterized protein (DUF1501 family)